MTDSVLVTAMKLAASGIPVFPCKQNKTPYTEHGFKDASAGEGIITEWWTRWPNALIGVPTGKVSGFDVLDVDVRHQEASDWWGNNSFPLTRIHRTRSYGLHLLFQHSDVMRCSAGRIVRGVDTRADGGYIIWWPAAGFEILSDAPLAPWPDSLLAEFRPKPRLVASSVSGFEPNVCLSTDAWLRGLVRLVSGAPEGRRNQILFWAACRAGEAVRHGKASESFVVDVLTIAATKHAGLPQSEAQRTIQSGMNRHG